MRAFSCLLSVSEMKHFVFFFETCPSEGASPPGSLRWIQHSRGQKRSISQTDCDSNPPLGPRRDYKCYCQNIRPEPTVSYGRRRTMSQHERDAAAGGRELRRSNLGGASWRRTQTETSFQHLNKQRVEGSNRH